MLRGLDEELSDHKYSHVERERRFLVDPARRPALEDVPSILIEDHYIDGTRFRLRRMTESETGRVVLKLSKKYEVSDPLARPMVTAYLTPEEYALFGALPSATLRKRRFKTTGGFGIDLFEGPLAGLELAEIEQPDAAALFAVRMPPWVIREVSLETVFQGAALARLTPIEVAKFCALLS